MARWKLLNAHYINVTGNTWEYKETDRSNGRQIRREFEVPQHLSPFDPSDWNYRDGQDDGDVIVSHKFDDRYPKDYVFRGEPTPDMLPLDDEAKEISASYAGKWKHPIENLTVSYSQSLIDGFHDEMKVLQAKQEAGSGADIKALTEAVTQMAQMQATVMAALTNKPVERRT